MPCVYNYAAKQMLDDNRRVVALNQLDGNAIKCNLYLAFVLEDNMLIEESLIVLSKIHLVRNLRCKMLIILAHIQNFVLRNFKKNILNVFLWNNFIISLKKDSSECIYNVSMPQLIQNFMYKWCINFSVMWFQGVCNFKMFEK